MSRNIKEIGKELLGKSLNSYHRRTGLTQLEKNNNIQDGILDGILSQVDDAYIEKTEQSNVIHLEGSGDGVVVLDGIEGNTMVNLATMDNWREGKSSDTHRKVTITSPTSWKKVYKYFHLKPNTIYTIFIKITNNSDAITGKMYIRYVHNQNATTADGAIGNGQTGVFNKKITLDDTGLLCLTCESGAMTGDVIFEDLLLLEGDWTNKEMPTYFEGLQSSFEEKVNSDNKHEIEILMKNKNLFDTSELYQSGYNTGIPITSFNSITLPYKANSETGGVCMVTTKLKKGVTYTFKVNNPNKNCSVGMAEYLSKDACRNKDNAVYSVGHRNYITSIKFTPKFDNSYIVLNIGGSWKDGSTLVHTCSESENYQLEVGDTATKYTPKKQNKIKLLLDEPLRKVNNNYKDRLCIKDGRLVVERKCGIDKNLHLRNWTMYTLKDEYPDVAGFYANVLDMEVHGGALVCDKFKCMERDMHPGNVTSNEEFLSGTGGMTPFFKFNIKRDKLSTLSADGFKTYLQQNPVTVVYPLLTPIYEEVLNECGDPILLEGYENGTVYIDSTIVPTTTVRYTPKMESLKTLKAVNDNNIMLTDDINNNIIDYMMNIDMMIMEKEMQNTKTRRIGEKDMTNMQKRTFEMLKRLIKGKTLTEQECKDRVVLYLSADKITSEQAEELMVYISEIYN